ncbi:helix-turn-helix domain-containing protein [Embleya sp. NPDC059259]|uniref:helix-turn-helix domain-containing protein n=1 Tax=unclassified Embleya TaxID=2699296 RepID=UPI00367A4EE7
MTAEQPPPGYVITGPCVVVSAEVCAFLVGHADLDRLRIAARIRDPRVYAALLAIHTTGHAWAADPRGLEPRTSADFQPRWITTEQAADILDVDPRHIRRLLSDGRLDGRRDNRGRWRVDRASVDRRAAQHRWT